MAVCRAVRATETNWAMDRAGGSPGILNWGDGDGDARVPYEPSTAEHGWTPDGPRMGLKHLQWGPSSLAPKGPRKGPGWALDGRMGSGWLPGRSRLGVDGPIRGPSGALPGPFRADLD